MNKIEKFENVINENKSAMLQIIVLYNMSCSGTYEELSQEQKEKLLGIIYNFYLKNETLKTIDQCHNNCKSCFGQENINNTNCKSCPPNKFLYLRNCLDQCTKGYFIYNQNDTLINVCNCENNSCQYCTIESLEYNLCETCNINNGYFPKINDSLNIDRFINCYKEIEGYYIDYKEKIFKPCYSKCKTCTESGDDNNHNCLTCNSEYTHREDFINDKNCYDNCLYYYYYDSNNIYQCTLNESCPIYENKFIKNKNKCISDCSKDNIYKYGFENECFDKCPKNTKSSKENEYICVLDCPEDLPYEKIIINKCVKNCTTNELIKKLCIINNKNAEKNKTNQDNTVINFQKDIENGSMDSDILNLTQGDKKDIVYEESGISIQLTTTENQNNNEYNNKSTIRFGECEDKLKEYYQIEKDLPLLIFKIDVFEEGLLIPKIEYEVYNPLTREKLNLSVCSDIKIDLAIPVSINEDDLYKNDSKSNYYNNV
jgi:hypothetical protein